ncbi:MAG: hypothetical protein AB8B55_02910 [Mariniblastus sp.]
MIKRLADKNLDSTERFLNQYHRPNDKWVDTPIQTTVDGETKIVTVKKRSLREKRRIFTLSFTAFTIGALMILMSSPYSKEFLVPGGLSSNHGQILAGQGADRCAACHQSANGSLASWIASSISLGKSQGLTQSELCMKCHDKTFEMDTSLNPHNVAPIDLAKISSKHSKVSLGAGAIFHPPVDDHKIACAACHREHHGSNHDLAAMTDQQCQTCHQDSFHSFETDHPEFVNYPLSQRSKIAFDHTTHAGVHFPGKQAEFNCNQCHVDDSFQNVKQLVSFEEGCASCHDKQILESTGKGLALITLPMIDTEAIEASELRIGSWPMAATGDFDGVIPPIMRVMLAADSKAAEVLDRLGTGFEFSDIDPTDKQQVNDAVEIVWATKRLLYDLSVNGPLEIRSRLETVMGVSISNELLKGLVSNLDEQVFQNAVARWLPNLAKEVNEHRQANLSTVKLTPTAVSWWPSENDLLLNIGTDDDLLAPNPLAELMGTKERSNPPSQSQDAPQLETAPAATTPIVRIPANKTPESGLSETKPARITLRNSHLDVSNDSELLAANPLQRLLSGESAQTSADQGNDNLPIITTPAEPRIGIASETIDKSEQTVVIPKSEKRQSADWLHKSGWYRNDQVFNISYRPTGHADESVKSWLELVSQGTNEDSHAATKQLFKETLGVDGFGLCRNCHTVDEVADLEGSPTLKINWKSEYRDPAIRTFTRFAHGPHMIQANLQDCSHCHTLDPNASNKESFASFDSNEMVSNFLAIKKSNCSSCHQKSQTENSCTQCHNYHVGSRVIGTE